LFFQKQQAYQHYCVFDSYIIPDTKILQVGFRKRKEVSQFTNTSVSFNSKAFFLTQLMLKVKFFVFIENYIP